MPQTSKDLTTMKTFKSEKIGYLHRHLIYKDRLIVHTTYPLVNVSCVSGSYQNPLDIREQI